MDKNITAIGCGYWGKNLVRNFAELGALHTICDSNREALNRLETLYPNINREESLESVLASKEIKGVVISSPAITHYSMAKQALAAGKDIFVEKPLCLTVEEGEGLVKLAEEKGKILMVGHLLGYHPGIAKLKELVDNGELGKLNYIYSSRLNLGKFRTEENILWSFAPHDISIILLLLNEMPEEVSARGGCILKAVFLLRILTKYALKKAEMVTCSSETVRRELIKFGVNPAKVSIINQGVDTQTFSPRQDKELKDRLEWQGRPVVISTRDLKPVYNVEMLVRAIPIVLKYLPQLSFIIASDGEQREYLENLASSLECSRSIKFVGWLPHDELPQYLASSDVYVSTSLCRSASLGLREAIACEIAPVVTDLSDNREWVTDGENGFLVPISDIQTLANKIVYLLRNQDVGRKFGRLGRKIIQERAEYKREMERMERLYQELTE